MILTQFYSLVLVRTLCSGAFGLSVHPNARGRPRGSARWMLGALAAPKPTACTHLRLQQADLLHFLQRQQRVADRVLEQHVQQHLERKPARQRQRGPQVCPAPLPRQSRAPARAPARTRPKSRPSRRQHTTTTPHHGARSWPGSQCGERAVARGTRLRRPRPRAAGQSEAWGDTIRGLRRGPPVVSPGGRWGWCERWRAGLFRPPLWRRLARLLGKRGSGPSCAVCKTVWKDALMLSSYKLRAASSLHINYGPQVLII